jgi:hypothetical protein
MEGIGKSHFVLVCNGQHHLNQSGLPSYGNSELYQEVCSLLFE